MRKAALCVLLVGVVSLLVACPDQLPTSPDGAGSYPDGDIVYLVGSKPGGGYDLYARLVARYLQKYLPGSRVRVKNTPGAGSIVAFNRLAVARPDGLTIGTFNSGLLYAQLLGNEALQEDLASLSWIGKAATNQRVLVASRKSGFRTLEAMGASGYPVLFGASAVGSASHSEALMMGSMLGLKLKIITGFAGNDSQMSMLRGEIAASFGSLSSYRSFVSRGDGVILMRIGKGDRFERVRSSNPPGVDGARSEAVFNLIDAVASLGRVTAAPPDVPDRVLVMLRDAYDRALSDPGLLAEAERLGLPIDSLSGNEVESQVMHILDQPEEFRGFLRTLTGQPQEERTSWTFY